MHVPAVSGRQSSTVGIACWRGKVFAEVPTVLMGSISEVGCCMEKVSTQLPAVSGMQRSTGEIACWRGKVSMHIPTVSGVQGTIGETVSWNGKLVPPLL